MNRVGALLLLLPAPIPGWALRQPRLAAPPAPVEASCIERSPLAGPLFVANLGQWETHARFVGRLEGMLVGAEPNAIALGLHAQGATGTRSLLVRLAFEGSSPERSIHGQLRREALFSYFLGNDPAAWVKGAPSFDEVRYVGLYDGIDMVLYARQGRLEYDLHLGPGKDPSVIRMNIEGSERLSLSENGTLAIHTALGDLSQRPARCFQRTQDGKESAVTCAYRILSPTSIGLELAAR